MHRACSLLETTDLPQGEIAARAGYRIRARMRAAFRMRLKLSPDEYRRRHRDTARWRGRQTNFNYTSAAGQGSPQRP